MSWEREPLLTKAKLFFERAFNESRDEPLFGLWCSLGLELHYLQLVQHYLLSLAMTINTFCMP